MNFHRSSAVMLGLNICRNAFIDVLRKNALNDEWGLQIREVHKDKLWTR